MPPGTVYVTILREPAAMFERFSYYNQYCPRLPASRPTRRSRPFLRAPRGLATAGEHFAMFAHNTLAYDLGGDNERSPATTPPTWRASSARWRRSSLVMIAEYFDESLVLLRRLLAWGPGRRVSTPGPTPRRQLAPLPPSPAARRAGCAKASGTDTLLDAGSTTTSTPPSGAAWRVPSRCVERERRAARGLESACCGAPGDEPVLRPAGPDPHQAAAAVAAQPQGGHQGYDLPSGRARSSHRPGSSWPCLRCSTLLYLLRRQKRRGRHALPAPNRS